MPTKRMRPTSAKQLAIEMLASAGKPLRAKELAKQIIESGRCSGLKGKTPAATISAMLAVGSKPGGPFMRVEKGTYTLADGARPTPKRKAAVARASAANTTKRANSASKRARSKAKTAR